MKKRGKSSSARRNTKLDRVVSLSLVVAAEEPPNEFCIFTAGTVETTKGTFTFDEAAAQSVMADYKAHGIDLMIDYDHASLASMSVDPALSGKAAGWFNIEVRNGELWAVNVRWTEPAAEALRRKEWRFMSPAFSTDDGRICSLLNVAITNLPATRKLEPLMAASITALGEKMDSKLVASALDALIAGDAEKCMELLKGLVASAAGGADPDATTEDAPPPVGDGGADESTEPVAAAAPPEHGDKPEEVAAALSAITSLSGKASLVGSIADVRAWHTSHVELAAEKKKIAEREAVIEAAERRKLCVELVKLGAEFPATVWADDKATTLKPRWLQINLAELQAHTAEQRAARGGKSAPAPVPPVSGEASHGLSERELKLCAEKKIDPAKYAATRAGIKSRSNVNGVEQ